MKKLLLLFMFTLTLCSVYTQNPKKANDAEKLLERISKRYKAFKSMKADFVYMLENKQEKSQEKQKGTIQVKGNKFRLDIANQLIICNNKTIWTYSREVNEVQINHYSPKDGAIRLDDIFTMYGKGFLYKIIEVKREGNKDITYVELTPKDKKKKFFKIKVAVDKANQTILSSQVYDKNGSIHTYSVMNQVPNLKFDDNQFEFDVKKYAGVEVVDLR
ncbi:MAG: outer membrane lipoprotein carrier protein LolA [Burkholderiales bacterium]|nr:outer membrane lipoprotein carrier protein LolA [Bacteroidia bacterium]